MNYTSTGEQVAAEVRAALARHRKSRSELAEVLGLSLTTVGRRLSGESPFTVAEVGRIAAWLGINPASLMATPNHTEASA